MTIAFGALHQASFDNTDATTYGSVTASITPTANELQILVITSVDNGNAANPPDSVSGCGITWAKVTNDTNFSSGYANVSVWVGINASPSTGQLTFTFPDGQDGVAWSWNEFSGDWDSTALNNVIQSAVATGTGTSFTDTLAAFRDANIMAFAGIGHSSTANIIAGTDFTESGNSAGPTSPNGRTSSEYQIGKTDDTVIDGSFAFSVSWGSVSIEFGEAQGLSIPIAMHHRRQMGVS